MKPGHLSQYFKGVVAKQLAPVEVDRDVSNQGEFNGVNELQGLLGSDRTEWTANWLYLADEQDSAVPSDNSLTWYDSRENDPNRTEWRLYARKGKPPKPLAVMEAANAGDLLVVARRQDDTLLMIVAAAGSTCEAQMTWLFNLDHTGSSSSIQHAPPPDSIQLQFVSRMILDRIGIEDRETDSGYLETMLSRFGGTFPPTAMFSEFARETLKDVCPLDDPDSTVVAWMEREELLFRTLERHLVENHLEAEFTDSRPIDVDAFLKFGLSVQNRRKSRAGHALEHHLEAVFQTHQLRYSRGKVTENHSKPDFLFPSVEEYHNAGFPVADLMMLAAKRTGKDRWRQVLSEAERISKKHLFMLEPSISENQTGEMRSHKLQLVTPGSLHSTFTASQQAWLMDLGAFLDAVKAKQT